MFKLNGGADLANLTSDCYLSALNVRILLDFEPRRQVAFDKAVSLVAGHMLIAHCVPEHREYIWTGAPSEPILAEAAARILNQKTDIPHFLLQQHELGFISKGDRGELVARLLLTLAHDAAILAKKITDAVRFSTPILLVDFLGAFLAPPHYEAVMNSTPTNIKSGDVNSVVFSEAFKDAVIHFTHFGKAGDDSLLNDEGAWMAFARGMAIQCANNQHTVDLCLPGLLSAGLKLSRSNMFPVWVQIKNKAKLQRVHIEENEMKFFSTDDHRPYVCISRCCLHCFLNQVMLNEERSNGTRNGIKAH